MIYVPNENVKKEISPYDSDLLFWKYNEKFEIVFCWNRTPKYNDETQQVYYVKDYDPFYLRVLRINEEEMMQCPLNACKAYPQLRYNKLINKWFCNCPSSAICTKNDDQDELDELLRFSNVYNEENGFFNNPIKAIINWNLIVIEQLNYINNKLLNKLNS